MNEQYYTNSQQAQPTMMSEIRKLWYQMFLSTLISSIVFHSIGSIVLFIRLRSHHYAKWLALLVQLAGFFTPIFLGTVTNALIASILVYSGRFGQPCHLRGGHLHPQQPLRLPARHRNCRAPHSFRRVRLAQDSFLRAPAPADELAGDHQSRRPGSGGPHRRPRRLRCPRGVAQVIRSSPGRGRRRDLRRWWGHLGDQLCRLCRPAGRPPALADRSQRRLTSPGLRGTSCFLRGARLHWLHLPARPCPEDRFEGLFGARQEHQAGDLGLDRRCRHAAGLGQGNGQGVPKRFRGHSADRQPRQLPLDGVSLRRRPAPGIPADAEDGSATDNLPLHCPRGP